MRELEIREEAENDISNSYFWYEEKRKGLGAHFMLCIEEAFSWIARNPNHFPELFKSVCRAFITKVSLRNLFYRSGR